ncbi:MBOAT family O-acyltransferase [Dyadobacter aurulentus]|uniref:MBOAT family O-acyltransferase n=1 Tax=Dyadobacter sp. UC 10 TaxID=2605428 RepID=UPI0011F2E9C5|nr:MBOAT family O-acyltransferase [Dyadobacter sp. UC 10]KAA0991323.1 MBOAT family protein [Dyadobacter sp. UC 10]
MLFNSFGFAFFLPVVFVLYWFVANKSLRYQNILLLVSSYFFYGCWDWRFLFLLAFSTALDFYSGLKIYNSKSDKARKRWLITSVVVNLGFLGYFKYCNFFIESFADLLKLAHIDAHFQTLNIILPIGISFYTFHGLSYVFDIYNRKIQPSVNVVEYSLFVSFFPLLVAGPIERATHLLPQIEKTRQFDYNRAIDGLRQMLWGFFKKLVIADGCADYVSMAFSDPEGYSGSTLLLGAIFFSFQIYGDFSGYSDIALGTARLFGFELLRNFTFPYFSRDIAEFWRRWHISLSSWFKDYLYFPLGGSRFGKLISIRNTMIIFMVSGLWHGASWNYLIWGTYHGLLFLPLLIFGTNRKHTEIIAKGRLIPSITDMLSIATTFFLVMIGWIFFRAPDLTTALEYLRGIFNTSLLTPPEPVSHSFLYVALAFMIIVEWFQREKQHGLEIKTAIPAPMRWALYVALCLICIAHFRQNQEFIYFQF